jgi:beta-phosphoglucomutase-like phosphatase (HAD superfamily)
MAVNAQPVIVFDCDGVLIDSEGLATEANLEALLDHRWGARQIQTCALTRRKLYGCPHRWAMRRVAEDFQHRGRPVVGRKKTVRASLPFPSVRQSKVGTPLL